MHPDRPLAGDERAQPRAEPRVRAPARRHAHAAARATFDAVFVHDAICYITTEEDLRAVADTAFLHTPPRAAPPCSRRTWCARPSGRAPTSSPGSAAAAPCEVSSGRGTRTRMTPPTPSSTHSSSARTGRPRSITNSHVEGLFSKATWLRTLSAAGFVPRARAVLSREALDRRSSWPADPGVSGPVENLWNSGGNPAPDCGFHPAPPVHALRISGGKPARRCGWTVPKLWISGVRTVHGVWTACARPVIRP